MDGFFRQLLDTEGYHPHGYCYLWQPGLIWLHVVSDVLIGLAYVAIGFALAAFVRRGRGELPFSRMFVAFGVFIAACGATHFMEVWTLWYPTYWFAGSVKLVTAVASVFTAVALPPLVPIALGTLRSARLSETRRVELEEAHERLKEADELKTRFFANVSHELRTPLTLILGPVEQLLAEESLTPGGRRRLAAVRRNADLLLKHVNDLLDVARLEAGQMGIRYERADLARMARLTASYFESAVAGRGVALSVEAPQALPVEVDAEKLERVLFNLLGNAVKFTPDGGRIQLVARAEPAERVRVEVHDSGPGVPPAERERIFEPFRQGDGGPARRYGGTGLGLAIVSDFVRLHGGRVGVGESPLGGAAFRVELPARAPGGAAVADAPPDHPAPPAAPPAAPAPEAAEPERAPLGPAGAPLVLVVEDNPEMSWFVAETLARDYRVERAFDGAEGVRRAAELRPDLVVSDVMMPGLTGEDLVREVRADPALDPVPIVLLSARADDDIRVRLLRSGAQDYLTKPFAAEELRARVGGWVATKRARDILQRELDTRQGDMEGLARSLATRKQELEAALETARRAVAEADAANRAKSDFLSVMSHELRTPLNAVMGYLDLLETGVGGPLGEKQLGYVDRAKQSSEHLLGLVDQILGFTRVEAGTEEVSRETVDLRAIVNEAAEMVAPGAGARGLEVCLDLPDEPVRARTDPAKVRQILLNLAGNAVKFTERGSVTLSLRSEPDAAVLAVRDTGPGIAPGHRERIFEPFWQVDASKTRAAGGTGLGLSITRSLVELLGGEIRVEGEPGAGTTFVVRLPRGGRPGEGDEAPPPPAG